MRLSQPQTLRSLITAVLISTVAVFAVGFSSVATSNVARAQDECTYSTDTRFQEYIEPRCYNGKVSCQRKGLFQELYMACTMGLTSCSVGRKILADDLGAKKEEYKRLFIALLDEEVGRHSTSVDAWMTCDGDRTPPTMGNFGIEGVGLMGLTAQTDKIASLLVPGADDRDASVKAAAVNALWHLGAKHKAPEIAAMLSSGTEMVGSAAFRHIALRVLAIWKKDDAVGYCTRALRGRTGGGRRDRESMRSCAEYLAVMEHKAAAPTVLANIGEYGREGTRALGYLSTLGDAKDYLKEFALNTSGSDNLQGTMQHSVALLNLGDNRAMALIRRAISEDDNYNYPQMITELAWVHPSKARGVIQELKKAERALARRGDDSTAQRYLAYVLGVQVQLGEASAVPKFTQLFTSSNRQARRVAIEFAGQHFTDMDAWQSDGYGRRVPTGNERSLKQIFKSLLDAAKRERDSSKRQELVNAAASVTGALAAIGGR